MKVHFKGTRGSIPTALSSQAITEKVVECLLASRGKDLRSEGQIRTFVEKELPFHFGHTYGGNTSCVQVETGSDEYLIFDGGSGLLPLGKEITDKEISGKLLRNNLARAIAFEEILTFENHREHELFLQYYATINTSPSYLAEVLALHNDINRMEPNKPLPKIQLQNAERKTVGSEVLSDGSPKVLYFWSQTQMNHYRNTLDRVERLQEKYPNIRFVGICIQPFNALVDQIQKMMEINPEDQFALIDFEKASKAWVLTLLNKSIILNSRGLIVEGFGNFYDMEFEKVLEGL